MNSQTHKTATFLLLMICWGGLAPAAWGQPYYPIKQAQKWGLIDRNGSVFLPPIYESIGQFDDFGYAVFQQDGKMGVIDHNGQTALPPIYEGISVMDSTLFLVFKDQRQYLLEKNGTVVFSSDFEKIQILANTPFLLFKKKQKWGLIERNNGKQLLEAAFDSIALSPIPNFFWIETAQGQGLFHAEQGEILPPIFKRVNLISDRIFMVQSRENQGWSIRTNEREIGTNAIWQSYEMFNDTFLIFRNGNLTALFNTISLKFIAQGNFDSFYTVQFDAIAFRRSDKVGLIDMQGNLMLEAQYDEIAPFEGYDLFRVRRENLWGIVAKGDTTILPLDYNFIAPLSGGGVIANVLKNGLAGIVNLNAKLVIEPQYDQIEIVENVAKAYKNGALTVLNFNEEGIINEEQNFSKVGTIKIGRKVKIINSTAANFNLPSNQLSNFEWFLDPLSNLWGLRRLSDGAIQIKPTYKRIQIFKSLGFTVVGLETRTKHSFDRTMFRFEYLYGIVNNERGLPVTEVNLLDIRLSDFTERGLSVARVILNGGRHGLMAKNGKILFKDYAFVGEFNDGKARVSLKGVLSGSTNENHLHLGSLKNYLNQLRSPYDMEDFTLHDKKFFSQGNLTCANCLWGYMDTLGRIVVEPQYEYVEDFKNGVGLVVQKGQWGAIDAEGKNILNFDFDWVNFLKNSDNQLLTVSKKQKKLGLIDTSGRTVLPSEYDAIGEVQEGLVAVRRQNLWGFCDLNGKEVIGCQFDEVQPFSEGRAAVRKKRKWGFIDTQGNEVLPYQFQKVGNFKSGLVWVQEKNKIQFIDNQGVVKISTPIDEAKDFENDLVRVRVSKFWGLLNRQGEWVVAPKKYLNIEAFDENGLAVVKMGNLNNKYYALINRQGKRLTKSKLDLIEPFSNGLALVRSDQRYGYLQTDGTWRIKPTFNRAQTFSEERAFVENNKQWALINLSGQTLAVLNYDKTPLPFKDGYAVVYPNHYKSNLMNRNGEVVLQSDNQIIHFSQGKAVVRDETYRHAYLSLPNGYYSGFYQEILPYQYGIGIFKKDGKWGIFNQLGVEMIAPKYDLISDFKNGYAVVRLKHFQGIADLNGNVILPPDYEHVTYWGDGVFRIERGDWIGYLDRNARWIWRSSDK